MAGFQDIKQPDGSWKRVQVGNNGRVPNRAQQNVGIQRGRQNVARVNSPNQVAEINALYQGIRNAPSPRDFRRPVGQRGWSGAELAPDGSDPGNRLDAFNRLNSEENVQARHDRVNREGAARGQRYANAGMAAVQERKNLQAMGEAPFQQEQRFQDAQRVKSDDGYMTIFDGKGKAVGTNRPMPKADSFDGLSSTNLQNAQLPGMIQDSVHQGNGYGGFPNSGPQQIQGPPRPNFLDESPPSGGTGGSAVVGSAPGQEAPGGGSFPFPMKPLSPMDRQEDLPQAANDFNKWISQPQPPAKRPPVNGMPDWMNESRQSDIQGPQFQMPIQGPQLQYSQPGQLDTLKRLNQFSAGTTPGASALEAKWNNVFPNEPDNALLQQQFPDVFAQNPSVYHAWKQLIDLSKSPQYQSQYQ